MRNQIQKGHNLLVQIGCREKESKEKVLRVNVVHTDGRKKITTW